MSKRGKEHNVVQRLGKERDNYVCQVCGSSIQPEGHHIINYQYGGAANVDNIMTLCRECHKAVHRGTIDILIF